MITETFTTFAGEPTELTMIIFTLITEYDATIVSVINNTITFTLTETPDMLFAFQADLGLTKI